MALKIVQIVFLLAVFGGAGALLIDKATDFNPLWGVLGGWVIMVCVLVAVNCDEQSEHRGMY